MSNERRAALSAAFDKLENEGEEETQEVELEEEELEEDVGDESNESEVAEEDPEEGAEETEDSQRIEQEAASRQAPKQSGKQKEAKPGAKQASGQPGTQQTEVKAPQSWTPAEREHWAKMPLEAQRAVARRELEVQQVLSRSADSRKFQDHFVRTVQPFAHLIRAQNSSPLQAVHNLMTTAAGLTTGTQPQKAQIVAEIIQNYGVDIQTLDDVLSKRPVQQQTAPNALPPQFAEALRPIHQFMSQTEQARAQHIQQINAQAEQTVSQYADKLDFFEDLREEMADFMEVAASRGKVMSIEQAHAMAVNANPEIKRILDQRARAVRINQDPNKIKRSRRAGSSVVGAPNGSGDKSVKPTSRRQALLEAWDDATS